MEGRNAHLGGEVRTWLSQLRADYPALDWDASSNLFPWLVRHVAWLQARYGIKSTDGVTPYRAAMGSDYQGALCSFGETTPQTREQVPGQVGERSLGGETGEGRQSCGID